MRKKSYLKYNLGSNPVLTALRFVGSKIHCILFPLPGSFHGSRDGGSSVEQLHLAAEQGYHEAEEQPHTSPGRKRKKPGTSPSQGNQSMDEIIQVRISTEINTRIITKKIKVLL